MRTVHIRIGHDDDPAVPQLFEIEGSFAVAVTDSGADGGDHRLNFQILQHLVQRAFSTFMSFPRIGRMAWNRRSRPCLAEPPAESPSTM